MLSRIPALFLILAFATPNAQSAYWLRKISSKTKPVDHDARIVRAEYRPVYRLLRSNLRSHGMELARWETTGDGKYVFQVRSSEKVESYVYQLKGRAPKSLRISRKQLHEEMKTLSRLGFRVLTGHVYWHQDVAGGRNVGAPYYKIEIVYLNAKKPEKEKPKR